MVNDTYNNLRAAIGKVENSLAELKTMLNMTTDDAPEGGLDEGAPTESAPPDQFSTPALANSAPASAPTVEVVDESEVPEAVKAQDQGA